MTSIRFRPQLLLLITVLGLLGCGKADDAPSSSIPIGRWFADPASAMAQIEGAVEAIDMAYNCEDPEMECEELRRQARSLGQMWAERRASFLINADGSGEIQILHEKNWSATVSFRLSSLSDSLWSLVEDPVRSDLGTRLELRDGRLYAKMLHLRVKETEMLLTRAP